MKDPHKTKIGLISDGTLKGTLLCDPATEQWKPNSSPIHDIVYNIENGIAWMTVKITAVPARIKGVVTDVVWMNFGCKDEILSDYEPPEGKNPIGRRMHFECDGIFAEIRPLDAETEAIMSEIPFVGMTWKYANGDFNISLRCLTERRQTPTVLNR